MEISIAQNGGGSKVIFENHSELLGGSVFVANYQFFKNLGLVMYLELFPLTVDLGIGVIERGEQFVVLEVDEGTECGVKPCQQFPNLVPCLVILLFRDQEFGIRRV